MDNNTEQGVPCSIHREADIRAEPGKAVAGAVAEAAAEAAAEAGGVGAAAVAVDRVTEVVGAVAVGWATDSG